MKIIIILNALLFCMNTVTWAQSNTSSAYPNRSIKLIVPYAPGGGTDLTARLMAKVMTTSLGQSVVVENRAGAGGTIGNEAVAKAQADGYTLLFSAAGPLTVSPHTYSKLTYEPIKSFAPIALIAAQPLILVVNANSPFNSVADIIKAGAAKNSKLNYGSFGNGSVAHLAGESFKLATKINMTHIPYKGTSPALTALLGGEIDLMFDTISTSAPFVKSGKLRALAIAYKNRSPLLPNVPTMEQAGVNNFEAGTWYGVLAPAGTDKKIIQQINNVLNQGLKEKEITEIFTADGAVILGGTPEEFNTFFLAEYKKNEAIVKAAGVTEN
jgi:tripartite-type tricarboxylate transporter receptor subunit TctC